MQKFRCKKIVVKNIPQSLTPKMFLRQASYNCKADEFRSPKDYNL